MTNSEMIKTLNKIMLINYTSCYKVLTEDGTYAVPFEQEVNALKHAISLLEAEGEGRLTVTPCKVGSIVWLLLERNDSKSPDIVKSRLNRCVTHDCGTYISCFFDCKEVEYSLEFSIDEFGKTVFLTREEAEGKLKGMK